MNTLVRPFAVAVATTLVAAAAAAQSHPGDQSRWSLDFSARMEQQPARPIEVHMKGDWISTIAATRAGEYDAELQLKDVQLTGEAAAGAPAASVAALESRLSRPFWATYREDGGLIGIHFYRDMAPSDRNLLEMIATELQIVRPPSARSSWTSQERDGAGEYSALYVMPQADRILKRKLQYTYTDGVAGASTDAMRVAVDQSEISFSLAPDHRIQSIDGNNRVRIDLSTDRSQQLAAATEFHASNLRISRAPELIGSLGRAHAEVNDSPIVTQRPDPAAVRAEADDRLLKGFATDEILGAAFTKDNSGAASADRLTALFRRRPEAASQAASLLVKNGPQKRVTNALGASGSPAAVAALDSLAHNAALAANLRTDAIVALVETQHPSAEAMRIPRDLVNDSDSTVQSAARMMSGALAHAGRSEHPAQADAIDASLIALYRKAHDVREKTAMLGALGNSAGPSVIPVVEQALRDMHAPVRAAAARALRLAPGPDVDRTLAAVITSDSEAGVRSDAIFAARFRRPMPAPIADALLKAAASDKADYVRSDALAVLRQNPTASVRIPETLGRIAKLDVDPGIRRQAREALAAFSPTTHP